MSHHMLHELQQFEQKLTIADNKETVDNNVAYTSSLAAQSSASHSIKQQNQHQLHSHWLQQAEQINQHIDALVRATLESNKQQIAELSALDAQLVNTLTVKLTSTYTTTQLNDVQHKFQTTYKQCVDAYNELLQQLEAYEHARQQQLNTLLQSTVHSMAVLQHHTAVELQELFAEPVQQINLTLNTNIAEYKLLVDTLIQQCTTQHTEHQCTLAALRSQWPTHRCAYLMQRCRTELVQDVYVKHQQKATLIGKINKRQTALQQQLQDVVAALLSPSDLLHTLTISAVTTAHTDITQAINTYDNVVKQVVDELAVNNQHVQHHASAHIDTYTTLVAEAYAGNPGSNHTELSGIRELEAGRYNEYTASVHSLQQAHHVDILAYRRDVERVVQYLTTVAQLVQQYHSHTSMAHASATQQQQQLTAKYEQQLSTIQAELSVLLQQLHQANTVQSLHTAYQQYAQLLTADQHSLTAMHNQYAADVAASSSEHRVTTSASMAAAMERIVAQFGLQSAAERERLASERAAVEQAKQAQQDAEDALLSKAELAKVKKQRERSAAAAAAPVSSSVKKKAAPAPAVVQVEQTIHVGQQNNSAKFYVLQPLLRVLYSVLERPVSPPVPAVASAVSSSRSPLPSKPGTPNTSTSAATASSSTSKSRLVKKKVEAAGQPVTETPAIPEYRVNTLVLDCNILCTVVCGMQSQLLTQLHSTTVQTQSVLDQSWQQYLQRVHSIQQAGIATAQQQLSGTEHDLYRTKLAQAESSELKLQRHLQRQAQLLNTAQFNVLSQIDAISAALTAYNTMVEQQVEMVTASRHTSVAAVEEAGRQYKQLHKDAITQLDNLFAQCRALLLRYQSNAKLSDTQYIQARQPPSADTTLVQQQLQGAAVQRTATVNSLQQSIEQLQHQRDRMSSARYDGAARVAVELVHVYSAAGIKYGQPIRNLQTQYSAIIAASLSAEQEIADSINRLSEFVQTGAMVNGAVSTGTNLSVVDTVTDGISTLFKQCYRHAQQLQCLVAGVCIPLELCDGVTAAEPKGKTAAKVQQPSSAVDGIQSIVQAQIQQCRDAVLQNITEYEARIKPAVEADTGKSKTLKVSAAGKAKRASKRGTVEIAAVPLPGSVQVQIDEVQRGVAEHCHKAQYNLLVYLDKLYALLLQIPDRVYQLQVEQEAAVRARQIDALTTEYNQQYKAMLMVYADLQARCCQATDSVRSELSAMEQDRHTQTLQYLYKHYNQLTTLQYQCTQTVLSQLLVCGEKLFKLYDLVLLPTDIIVPASADTTHLTHYHHCKQRFHQLMAPPAKATGADAAKSTGKRAGTDTITGTYASVRSSTCTYIGLQLDVLVPAARAGVSVTDLGSPAGRDGSSSKAGRGGKSKQHDTNKTDSKPSTDKKSKKTVVEAATCSTSITALALPIHTAVSTARDYTYNHVVAQYNKTMLTLTTALENQVHDEQSRHVEMVTQIQSVHGN